MTRRRRERVRRARNMLIRWRSSRVVWSRRRPAVVLDGARAARQFRDDRAYRDYVMGYDRWTLAERLAAKQVERAG